MFSSGASAIAQADVTKHAKEIPIVRGMGMHRILFAEHPAPVQQVPLSMPIILDG
jgi:hypothetical protein